jgi:hypothetical protein
MLTWGTVLMHLKRLASQSYGRGQWGGTVPNSCSILQELRAPVAWRTSCVAVSYGGDEVLWKWLALCSYPRDTL